MSLSLACYIYHEKRLKSTHLFIPLPFLITTMLVVWVKRVNELNVASLLEASLVYHETELFVKVCQITYFINMVNQKTLDEWNLKVAKDSEKWNFLFDIRIAIRLIKYNLALMHHCYCQPSGFFPFRR